MLLSKEEFIDRVVPDDGAYYYNIKFEGADNIRQWEAANKKEVIKAIESKGRGADVYIALASFVPDTNRKGVNVLSKCVFPLDLDCGEGKGFKTQLEAMQKLAQFCKDVGIPMPNLVVNSGYGWHVYYVCTEAISPVAWKRIATKLKECCIQYGFPVDGTVTTDVSRILRVPETYNWKDRSNPKLVEVVVSTPDIDIRELTAPLIAYAGPMNDELPDLKPTGKVVDNSELGVAPEYEKQYAEFIIKDCAVFNSMYASGGDNVAEPLWMAALHLLAFCEDGEQYVHSISKEHSGYTEAGTNSKFKARMLAKGETGPTLCTSFAEHCPNECSLCVHNGKIKSPIALGVKPKDITTLPKGYISTENGIYIAGDEDTQPIKITNWNIENMKVLTLYGEGSMVTFTAVERHSRTEIKIPNKLFGDLRGLNKCVAEQGIVVRTNSERSLAILMTSWSQLIRDAGQAKVGFNAFGWLKDKNRWGFSTAAGVKWEDGEESPPIVYDNTTMDMYTPAGDIKVWKKAVALVLVREDQALVAGFATAFGAPLMKFTSESGGLLSLVSPDSGTGKSGAIRTGQAVWGSPATGINALDDTDNAVIKRMGYLNNIPVYWDELRGDVSYAGVLKALFRLGQGREKARLTSSTEFQRSGKWETIMTVATNERITEHIQRADSISDAGLRRVLELNVDQTFRPYVQEDAKVFKDLNDNYGHAGEIYAKYLVENHKTVEQVVTAVGKQVTEQAGNLGTEARVWVSMATAIIAGAMLARKAGLVDFNIPKLMSYITHNIRGSQKATLEKPVSSSPKGVKMLIDTYMQQQGRLNSFLECNKLAKQGHRPTYTQSSKDNAIRTGATVLGHVDDKGTVRFVMQPFKQWIRKPLKDGGGGGVPDDVFKTLERMKSYRRTKASLSAPLKANIAVSGVPCFDVSLQELDTQ